jgi:thioredoxin 1
MAVEFTDANFKELVLDSNKPVLVDFWATWCGPCRAIAPVIEELHTELEGKAIIGKVDVDQNSDTSVTYGVRNIPTLLIFKDGKVVDKVVGNQPKSKLIEILENHM